MKVLLCSVPDGALQKVQKPLIPRLKSNLAHSWSGKDNEMPTFPIGILRVLSAIQKNEYDGDIYDINNLRHSDEEIIMNLNKVKPDVVGLSGPLSHCYPNLKRITKIVRDLFPKTWIIVGGHISGSSQVVLNKTETDIVVLGDGEISFVKLLDYIKLNPDISEKDHAALNQIQGLAFLDKNNKLKLTGYGTQIIGTDMEYPSYDKWELGLQEFGGSDELVHEVFEEASDLRNIFGLNLEKQHYTPEILKIHERLKGKKVGRIQTSKGCVAKCTFCQRATKGYRVFGQNHMEPRIIELKEKYNVGVLLVDDENFGSNRIQGYECARLMKKHGIYWSSQGARAASISVEDLKFYKAHNLLAIRYGIESGSQTILDIMEKKTTTQQVYEQIQCCTRLGVATTSEAFMLGYPGESRTTALETAEYNAQLRYLLGNDWNTAYPAWATSIPGTPLYEYSQQIGVIGNTLEEEEDYLYRTADTMEDRGILNYLNKTEHDIKEVHYWIYLYRYAGKKAFVNEIIKKNWKHAKQPVRRILSQIYHQCIKESFKTYKNDFKSRVAKKINIFKKINNFIHISAKFFMALMVIFLPKVILFPILKLMSDVSFYILKKRHKSKSGTERYNFFVDRRADKNISNNLKITDDKIAKTTRTIERSLRSVVKVNSEQIKFPLTDEEKSLQLLARQQ